MSEFGRLLGEHAHRAGVAIEDLPLEEWEIQGMIDGTRAVDPHEFRLLEEALGLTEEELLELMFAWSGLSSTA